MLDQPGEFDISTYELSRSHDIRPLVINTLLTYLELEGFLKATSPFYSTYKISLTRDFEHLLNGFDSNRQSFLRKIFETAKPGYKWLELNPEDAAGEIGESKEKIIKAIGYLEVLRTSSSNPLEFARGIDFLRSPMIFSLSLSE